MILLMSTPQSDDMISYNRPFAVTVRSWGTSFLTLAGITSVTLQRGGSDSVYNIYKQPLVINVNMEFTSLVDGAIAFSSNDEENKIPEYEKTSYAMTGNILSLNSDSQNIDGSVLPTVVPTVGGIIRSLQPVQFSGLTYGFGPQQSTRDNVMVGGNGNVGPLPFGQNLGILSAFGGIYDYAKNSALNQFEFGTYLLGGVTDTMNGITNSAISITAGVNNVLNATTNLANTISLGAFSNTQFANQIRKTQNTMNGAVLAGAAVTSATNQLENSLNYASRTFGSLLSVPVGN